LDLRVAGERKVDTNAHEPLSERARAAIQVDVNRLYAEFCALVAVNRGLTSEAVRGRPASTDSPRRAACAFRKHGTAISLNRRQRCGAGFWLPGVEVNLGFVSLSSM